MSHAKMTGLEDIKVDLIAHLHQTCNHQLEDQTSLHCHKVPHILQYQVPRSVVVVVAEKGQHQTVLELAVILLGENIHDTKTLTGRPSHNDVHIPLCGHLIT